RKIHHSPNNAELPSRLPIVSAKGDSVGSRRCGSARIEKRLPCRVDAVVRARQITAPQPHAPAILGSIPVDRGIHQLEARLAQTVVRVPTETAVVVIADDETEGPTGRRHTVGNADGRRTLRGSHRIKTGRVAHALGVASDGYAARAEG